MLLKLGIFGVGFVLVYGILHLSGIFAINFSETDLVILVGMYSMMGFIFSVVSGFVIQSKWHVWDKLIESSHGEITTLRQLQLISRHLPIKSGEQLRRRIRTYIEAVIRRGWINTNANQDATKALEDLEIEAFEDGVQVYEQVGKLLHWKEQRDNYSRRSMPSQLRWFLRSCFLVIAGMSLLFTVESVNWGLLFSGSVATLAFFLHLLVDDLDHPYKPGGWHFSSKEYEQLLD